MPEALRTHLSAPTRSVRRLGHRPALDGLRGVAFLLVFIGHAGWLPFLRASQTAMFLFFGLSGFLITQLLVEEWAKRRTVSLPRFFGRRALRLVPALAVFLAVWLLVALLFSKSGWLLSAPGGSGPASHGISPGHAFGDALVGILYISNWVQIYGHASSHAPLTHLWSLAVEEQFYIFWAPVLAVVLAVAARFHRRHNTAATNAPLAWLGILAVVLALASLTDAGFHFFLVSVHQPRVTYGSDTRAGAFLLGGAVAVAWSTDLVNRTAGMLRRVSARLGRPASATFLGAVTVSIALALLVAGRIEGDSQGDLAKTLSFAAASLCAPLLIGCLLMAPSSWLGRVLSHPVSTYIGRRSYALYLWHYVLLTWLNQFGFVGEIAALGASFAAAELSWRLVESRAMRLKARLSPVEASDDSKSRGGAGSESVAGPARRDAVATSAAS